MIPTLSISQRTSITEAFDWLIDELGKNCTLVYQPIQTECPNCQQDTATGRSSNIYKFGGPIPFTEGICPYCSGAGYISTEQTEVIKLRLIWKEKDVALPNYSPYVGKATIPVFAPGGTLETRGYMRDIPKIQRTTFLLAQNPLDGYKHWRYERLTEPGDNFAIIQNRYFSCMWERKG